MFRALQALQRASTLTSPKPFEGLSGGISLISAAAPSRTSKRRPREESSAGGPKLARASEDFCDGSGAWAVVLPSERREGEGERQGERGMGVKGAMVHKNAEVM